MSECIPMLSMTGTFLSNPILPIKGKWEPLRQRKLNITDLSLTRENDPSDAKDTLENPGVDRQGMNKLSLSSTRESLEQGMTLWPDNHHHHQQQQQQQQIQQEESRHGINKCSSKALSGFLPPEPSSSGASAAPSSVVEDELLSWLQYPIDENFERGYCSEFFGDVSTSGLQSFSSKRNQMMTSTTSTTTSTRSINLGNVQQQQQEQKPPNAEAAMALGVERAAGLRSTVGLEAFSRVRTSIQPPVPKWPTSTLAPPTPTTTTAAAMDLVARQPIQKLVGNFPIYSVPATTASSNFLVLQGPLDSSKANKSSSLFAESIASLGNETGQKKATPVKKEQPGSLTSAGGSSSYRTKSLDNDEYHRNAASQKKYAADLEATITSSSGGSENTTEKSEKAQRVAEKRKAKQISESTECQSEDIEAESVDTKKPARPKRSRAAEVHNLSERRRRDRINEKMRALQELIPNSNKTDKASMLDEAIEYLKMLQLQLQMMSMRSGMSLPPMVMSSGVQQMQIPPQMAAIAPYGMMGMGVNMNMVDLGSSSSLGQIDEQQQQQQQQQQLLEDSSYNVYVSQQQMQVPVQVVNRGNNLYNSYMLPAVAGAQQTHHHDNQQQNQHQQQQHQQFKNV